MAKAKRPDKQNPVFARAQLGVSTNHSSAVPSTDHTAESDHPQFDDALADLPTRQDPNLSGMTPTEDCYTYVAGQMDGWKENDDYRQYFENSVGCDGMLACDSCDGDYDDNGGVPTAIGHAYGDHRPKTEESLSRESYPLGRVIVRRI